MRGWLLVLGPVGAAAFGYVIIERGFVAPSTGQDLAWPLLGGLPLWVFGIWLLTATTSRAAVYVALAATGTAVSAAYEILIEQHPALLHSSRFALLNGIGLTADAVSAIGMLVMLAGFPTGSPERRWQRITLRWIWVGVAVAPLTLITTPTVVMSPYIAVARTGLPNPYAVPALAGLAPSVELLIHQPWPAVIVALGIFYLRAFAGPPEVRHRMRLMCWVTTVTLAGWLIWTLLPDFWPTQLLVFASMIALPLAGIHGILRHGAFDVAPDDRGRLTVRSSTLLITVLYAIALATPAVMLKDRLPVVGAVLLTAVAAVCLLPLRSRLADWIRGAVLGDRDRHLQLLAELGVRLEQTADIDQLLNRLVDALRAGLNASWVRIRLFDTPVGPTADGGAAEPGAGRIAAEAGTVTGRPVEVQELLRADERLGAIELGPRRHGHYSPTERELLHTIAGQTGAAVANVRLNVRLAEQLEELRRSRLRLVSAQDDERKRLERDLHDGTQQNVVALIAALRLARNRLNRGELAAEDLVELQDQAREILTDLREIAHGIRPPVLSDNGLVAAVESGVARFPIPLTVEADDSVRGIRFADDLEATAYYVVREALTNTVKHAGARSARVTLSRIDGVLRIRVSDDGCGIAAPPAGVGGLANLRDRVAALQGRLELTANRPTGTVVVAELPVG